MKIIIKTEIRNNNKIMIQEMKVMMMNPTKRIQIPPKFKN